MNASTPARDFLLPGINALLREAAGHGISREVAVAVIIDLVTGPGFNDVPIDPAEDVPATNTGTFPLDVLETAQAEAESIPIDDAGMHTPMHGRIGRRGSPVIP
jgi:hypothetical protein